MVSKSFDFDFSSSKPSSITKTTTITMSSSASVASASTTQLPPSLPRLSIESLHVDLDAAAKAAARNHSGLRPGTALSTTSSVPSAPPPAYLGAPHTYEKSDGEYMIPPHALMHDVESVYEVRQVSMLDRFQASHQLRMLFILILSFIIIGGIAAGVLVLLVKKS